MSTKPTYEELEKRIRHLEQSLKRKQTSEASFRREELLGNEALFRGLFDHMPSGSAIYEVINEGERGSDYIIRGFNRKSLELEGKTLDEVIGRSLFDLRPNIDDYGLIPVMKKVWETGAPAYFPAKIYKDAKYENYYENYIFRIPTGEVVTIYNDVTEQKKAEKTIRDSQKYLQELLETIQVGVFVHDVAEDRLVDFNQTALRTLGLTEEQIRKKSTAEPQWAFVTEAGEPMPVDRYPVNIVKRTKKPLVDYIVGVLKPSETEPTWALVSASPQLDADGNLSRVIVSSMDITKRKNTEKELQRSKAFFQAAMDCSQAGIAIADAPDGKLRYVNDSALGIRGKSKKEVVDGIGIHQYVESWQILHMDGTPYAEDEVPLARAIMFGEICTKEFIVRRPDNEDRIVWANAAPIYDEEGQISAGIVVFLDITDRKRAEKELERLTMILSEGQRLSHTGSWEYRAETKETFWTEEEFRIFGLAPSPKSPTYSQLLESYIHPDDVAFFDQTFKSALEEKSVFELEHRIVRPDGSIGVLFNRAEPHFDESGRLLKYTGTTLDITESKRAEEALRKKDARLANIASQVPGMLYQFMMKPDGSFSIPYSSHGVRDIFGCSPEEVKDDFGPIFNAIHPEDRNEISRTIDESVKNLSQWKCEYRVQLSGQPVKWVFGNSIPEKMADGSILWSGYNMDITERKKAEEELRKLYEAMDLAQKMAGIGYWSYDKKGGKRFWSSQMYKNFGLDERFGPPGTEDLRKVAHPDDWDIYKKNFKSALNGVPYNQVMKIFFSDGSLRYIQSEGHPMTDESGEVVGLIGTSQDITERVETKMALEESEKKYRNIFENAVEGFFRSTPEGKFKEVNPAFARMLGYDSPQELVSSISNIKTQYYVNPADRERYQKILRKFGVVDDIEFKVKRKDGDELWVSNSTRAYFDDDGNVTHYEGIVNDISERKKAEEEKEKLQSQLKQAAKMEAIGNLAGGIAHDFNNILATMIGFTEVALDEMQRGAGADDSLQEVLRAGKRARDLVRQILLFSRQSDKQIKPIQPDIIVKEVLKFIRSSIPSTIEIRLKIECDSLILGNSTQIHQMLMNLCTNAAQAMEDRGGVLTVRLKDIAVGDAGVASRLELKAGNYIEIMVADTGPGIPQSIMDSIFDPYYTTKGPGEGTGIGLAVVKGIVESHGGKIAVDSQLGKGSTFTLYLPGSKNERTAVQPAEAEKLPTGSERILFVDDELAIAKLGKQLLESLGYAVETRTSSMEALELFRAKPDMFDVVISDMTMPKMTGDKLALEMMKIRPDIPIILCTGYSKKLSGQSVAEIGIKALAYKPIVKADLAKTVRKVLVESKVRRKDD